MLVNSQCGPAAVSENAGGQTSYDFTDLLFGRWVNSTVGY